jgi:hypothetical protein
MAIFIARLLQIKPDHVCEFFEVDLAAVVHVTLFEKDVVLVLSEPHSHRVHGMRKFLAVDEARAIGIKPHKSLFECFPQRRARKRAKLAKDGLPAFLYQLLRRPEHSAR